MQGSIRSIRSIVVLCGAVVTQVISTVDDEASCVISQPVGVSLISVRQERQEVSQPVGWVSGSVKHCRSGGRWPSPVGANGSGKFDLVITWFQKSAARPTVARGTSLSETQSGMRFENNSEIKYQLRSFEKNGLLDYVRNVIILVDHTVIENNGPPPFFEYGERIRVVTDLDIGIDNSGCEDGCGREWAKWLTMHTIPDLTEYFIVSSDDIFLMKPFQLSNFFNEVEGKPILHQLGSFNSGWCDGGVSFNSAHQPHLINKCAMRSVAKHYADHGFRGGIMKGRSKIDAICLFSNAMRTEWIETTPGLVSSWYRECHTNAGCDVTGTAFDSMFVNFQGPGISDDYGDGNAATRGAMKELLHKEFGEPSRFEMAIRETQLMTPLSPGEGY